MYVNKLYVQMSRVHKEHDKQYRDVGEFKTPHNDQNRLSAKTDSIGMSQ